MIRTQEATGKTVDEARAKACALLGVQADDLNVSYEVLEMPQKTGFLGLKTTPAKVRVSVEEPDAPAAPVVEEKVEPEVKPVVEEAPAEEPKAEEPAAAPVAEEAAPAEETADPAAEGEEPEVPINIEENAKVKAAVDYLKEVIALMGVENVTFSAVQKGEATIIRLDGEKLGALIGRRGETMESLSYLASLVANRLEGDYIKLGLDVAGYRDKRENDLTVLAQRIGNKVRKTGRSFAMEPMNPYERRIIHSAIGKMEGVRSESKGEGRDRRVVIYSTAPDAQTDNTYGERRPRGNGRRPGGNRNGGFRGGRGSSPGMAVPAMAAPLAAAVPVLPACPSAPMLPVTQKLPHLWHLSVLSAWMILPISALARSSCKLR
ncbi:MAG: RNA-binding cell elongation regulator Jag/EloR [Faecalibacterium sp.]